MLIHEIVTKNPELKFFNDVQLGWYPNNENNQMLAKGYIFTDKAPNQRMASIAFLERVRDAYTLGSENRFVAIAHYGHGKTHFALALANFFGKPAGSEEVAQMLKNIEHASSPSKAQTLREFKATRAPYLVVTLRGDKPGDLTQKFVTALEAALNDQEATYGAKLSHWFASAERFLEGLEGAQREIAETFLRAEGTDLDELIGKVKGRVALSYQTCKNLSQRIFGTPLDFGAEVSLQDVVKQAVNGYCGLGKPFAGLLILFDEFSEFIRRYAERGGRGGASLQDLLNGVSDCRERVTFVAFSQFDPDTVAENIFRASADASSQESLKKELTRLPVPQRHTLYSSLETVLAAYLKQDEACWDEMFETALKAINNASDDAYQLFESRYDAELGWGLEKVTSVLTQGCFPLHPVTTALLCSVSLREVTNPRAVLGFVENALEQHRDHEAFVGNRPNWVYATELVDWFGEMLADQEWEMYQATLTNLGGDITEEQNQVLKAMFLETVAKLRTRQRGYARVVSILTGLPMERCEVTLQELANIGVIQHDPATKRYTFWTGMSGNRLDKDLKNRLSSSLNMMELNEDWLKGGSGRLKRIEVAGITWGNANDYLAREYILTRSEFTPDRLGKLAQVFHIVPNVGLAEGVRGLLIWLVAESEADLDWYHQNAAGVLDAALPGSNPPPVVLALPSVSRPEFKSRILYEQALKKNITDMSSQYGSEVCQNTANRYRRAVEEEMKQVRVANRFEVPLAYRASIAQIGAVRTVERALELCYKAAYTAAPSPFFPQYSLSMTNINNSVCRLSWFLSLNRVAATSDALSGNKVAQEVMTKCLRAGWGFVTGADAIQPPAQGTKLRKAWDYLDDTFKPGQSMHQVGQALIPLFNAPYGYNQHHILLLLSAWYGYHRQYLVLRDGAQRTSLDSFLHNNNKPKEIVASLCQLGVALVRQDKDVLEQEFMTLLQRMKQEQFTPSEARENLAHLSELAKDEKLPGTLRKDVEAARERVDSGLKKAAEYEMAAREAEEKILKATDALTLVKLHRGLSDLPKLSCVSDPHIPKVADLTALMTQRLNIVVESECQKYAKLTKIEDYTLQHDNLVKLVGNPVKLFGKDHLLTLVDEALQTLNAKRDEFKKSGEDRDRDSNIVAEIQGMSEQAGLGQVRRDLARLDAFDPRAEETKALIEKKRKALQGRVAELESFVHSLPFRLDQLSDTTQADALYKVIQRVFDSYSDTLEFARIEALEARCSGIMQLLKRLADIRASMRSVDTPQRIEHLHSEVSSVLDNPDAPIGPTQKSLFANLKVELQEKMRQGRSAAEAWLKDCQRQVQERKMETLPRVLEKMDRPHPFLTENEKETIAILRIQVQDAVDEDEVQAIKYRFLKIIDLKKRQACLKMLTQLAGNGEAG